MIFIIGIVVIFLLLYFVLLPMLKGLWQKLIKIFIAGAIILGVIFLCIAFPPLIIVVIGVIIYLKLKKYSFSKKDDL